MQVELQERLVAAGLKKSGTKEELTARLAAYLESTAGASDAASANGSTADTSEAAAAIGSTAGASDAATANGSTAGEAGSAEEEPGVVVTEAAEAAAEEEPGVVVSEAVEAAAEGETGGTVSEAVEAAAVEERSATLDGGSEDEVVRGREARPARYVAIRATLGRCCPRSYCMFDQPKTCANNLGPASTCRLHTELAIRTSPPDW